MNNNKSNKKTKIYKHWSFWIILIIALSLIFAFAYHFLLGGNIGVSEKKREIHTYLKVKETNYQLKRNLHNQSMPSASVIINDLKQHFNTNDLSSLNPAKVYQYLIKKYGSAKANLIMNGAVVSINMTPFQEQQTEIEIARGLNLPNTIVGLNQKYISNNILTNKLTDQDGAIQLGQCFQPDTVTWAKIDNHSVSSPSVLMNSISYIGLTGKLMNELSQPLPASPVIVFIKANQGDTLDNIKDVASQIKIKLDNTQLDYAYHGFSNNQLSKIEAQNKQWTLAACVINNFNINKNDEVFNGSLIPVMFQITDQQFNDHNIDASIPLTMNGHQYLLFLNQSNHGNILRLN